MYYELCNRRKTMVESTLAALEKLFFALSDKTRIRLLSLMANGEVSVGFLADTLCESQPKISRHLACLRTAGLVSTRRNGKWVYYGIEVQDDETIARVLNAALGTNVSGSKNLMTARDVRSDGITYKKYDDRSYISAETHMTNWKPNEIEVFLL